MSDFNFKNVPDEELLKMEQSVDSELAKVLLEMRYNENLEKMYQKLEAIKEEKRRRELDG